MKKLISGKYIRLWLFVLALSRSVLAQVVPVANVEDLYSAVNNPANAGATLVLAPGTYWLSPTDPYGAPRTKGGRIEFQMDMSIKGVEGDREAVVINASGLPLSSFPQTVNGVAIGPNAAVRMGLGHNALEWLTVRDAVNGGANIDTSLQPLDPGTAFILVAHIATSGSTRGMNLLNFGPQASGQTIEADIIDSDFFDNPYTLSQGIRIGNFQGIKGGMVNVRMSGNRFWGQKQGRLIVNNAAINSTVNVTSSGNRFYGNGAGTIIAGGLTQGTARADGNTINFKGHGDEFLGNTGITEYDHGGLVIVGTDNVAPVGGGGSNNTVNVQLWGCRMSDNQVADLYAVGARSNFGAVPADPSLSQNDHVIIEIHGDDNGKGRWQPVEFFADSLPNSPNYGNSVTVIE